MSKYKFENKGRSHLHTLAKDDVNYAPLQGTTTVINEVYPPPLAWYGSAKALEYFGWLKPKEKVDGKYVMFPVETRLASAQKVTEALKPLLDSPEKLLEELDNAYKAHDEYKKTKGKEGTDTHALIEKYINSCIGLGGGKPIPMTDDSDEKVKAFATWACRDVEKFLWSEAHCYSEKLWVGGITDFGFIHKNGKVLIGDNKPSVYPKHFIQTAGYAIQIEENGLFDSEGNKLLVETPKFDGYCIYDYNKGVANYLSGEWTGKLQDVFKHTVEVHGMLDLIGSPTL